MSVLRDGGAQCMPDGPAVRRLREGRQRIIVTGASGWLGTATLALLRGLLGEADFDRRVRCFGSSARRLTLDPGVTVAQGNFDELESMDRVPTIALHLAFLTKDKAAAMDEAVYVEAARALAGRVHAALGPLGVEALFIPSSGAAARADDPAAAADMRLYGRLKQEDEELFGVWAAASGTRLVAARIFNLSGPYINKHDAYALAAFIRDALRGTAIDVRAARPVYRSYVAIRELMALVFSLLTDGTGGVTKFETAGEELLEMGEIAARVAAVVAPDVAVRRAAPDDRLPPDLYAGERAPYAALLDRAAVASVPFDDQISETARYIARSLDPAMPKKR